MSVLVFMTLKLFCFGFNCDPEYTRSEPMPKAACEEFAKNLNENKSTRDNFAYCEDVG